jgi:hypothetical protein
VQSYPKYITYFLYLISMPDVPAKFPISMIE